MATHASKNTKHNTNTYTMMKMIRLRSSPAFTMASCTTATILFLILSIASTIPIAAANNNDDTTTSTAAADVEEPKLISTIEINLPAQPKRHRRKSTSSSSSGGGGGDDDNENCQDWAEQGECTANPGYMLEHCAASCAAVDNNGDDMNNNNDEEEEEEE